MKQQKFIAILEDLFELDPGEIGPDTPLEDVPGWDSLTFMSLIARVDAEFGVTLAPNAVTNCKTVGEVAALVDNE